MKNIVSSATGPDSSAQERNDLGFSGDKRALTPLNIFVLHPSMILTNHLPSGDGLLAYEFITRLAKRGHNMHVAVSLQDIKGEIPSNLHLHPVPATRSTPSPTGVNLRNRIEFGLRAGTLYRELRKTVRFDLAHQFNPVVFGLCFFAGIRDVPLIMGPIPPSWPLGTEYPDNFKGRLKKSIKWAMERFQFQFAAKVLPATPSALDEDATANELPSWATVCPYGIDTRAFAPSLEEQPAAKPPSILFLSNLWKRKGIFVLLDAFERVQQQCPGVELHIAGSGSDAEEVAARVKNHPCAKYIRLLGFVPRTKVAETLQACTVFCLPSFGEPFGMAALEAMSCGKPLVCTKAGGLAYLATPGGAIAVPPYDSNALADALSRVVSNPALAKSMGEVNRKRALNTFDWEAIIDRLESVYAQTLQHDTVPVTNPALPQNS